VDALNSIWEELLDGARAQPRENPATREYSDPPHVDCCAFHMSRRRFLRFAAGASALALTSPLWVAKLVEAQGLQSLPRDEQPRPISFIRRAPFAPETAIHEFPAARGNGVSTITDFDGYFGTTAFKGTGTRTNKKTGATMKNPWAGEIRFLQGTYVGVDGMERRGTFSFI
jgi:hypothetical protein